MRLHQHVVDVCEGDDFLVLPARFDQAAIAEVATPPEITLNRSYDEFGCGRIEGVGPQPDGVQLFPSAVF